MRRPTPLPSHDDPSQWKAAFIARLVRLCPDVGAEAAAEVSQAAVTTNQDMPPSIAAAEWAALWVRRVRPEATATAPAPQRSAESPAKARPSRYRLRRIRVSPFEQLD